MGWSGRGSTEKKQKEWVKMSVVILALAAKTSVE